LGPLARRARRPELMDQPDLDESSHRRALTGLGRINALSHTLRALADEVCRIAESKGLPSVRVLDVASGGGDVAIRLARSARSRGVEVEVHGCDISPTAVAFAQSRAERAGLERLSFSQRNVLEEPLPEGYDVVMCSLFLHHLDQADAEALLERMAAAATRMILVDDLTRSCLAYLSAYVGCRLLTTSPIVHTDGPLSVRAAFTIAEVRQLTERLRLQGATIRAHWPHRFLLSWRKP